MATTKQGSLRFKHVLLLRLINSLSMATFFQPDEYFQALEPAYQIALGPESGTWTTWEWQYQLRSSMHPLLFSVPYLMASQIAALLPLPANVQSGLLIAMPAILQGFIAAVGDWYTWKLAEQIYGVDSPSSTFTILLQVASPWQWYCASRTFSNSLETSLTICALAHWPWHLQRQAAVPVKENLKPVPIHLTSLRISLFLAALAVLLRPTNILIWLTAAAYLLPTVFPAQGIILAREALLCGSAALAVSVASDKWYFGFWAFPPYNWLSFNIVKSLAVFYGRNPWHYFLLQGLPLLCTTSLPFVLSALYSPRQSSSPAKTATLKTLVAIVYVTIITLSFISHKEVRFIYPLLPALNILAAPRAASFFTTKSPTPADLQQTTAEPKGRSTASSNRAQQCVLRNKSYLGIGLSINVLLAGYLSYVHQRAPITVLSYLRNDFEQRHPSYVLNAAVSTADEASDKPVDDLFALFLMPCHSTPWRSHLIHPMLSAYALSCDPPLHTLPNTPERDNYRDEADRFYDNPIGFLSTEMFPLLAHETLSNRGLAKPRYIVGYEGIQPWLESFIAETREGKELGLKLTQVWSGYNGLFAEDWRRAGKMIVWDTGLYE